MNFSNYSYVQELYERYLVDPSEIDPSWKQFFDGYSLGISESQGLKGELSLVELYRSSGHLLAHINPLNPHPKKGELKVSPEELGASYNVPQFSDTPMRGNELVSRLEEIYCGSIGFECDLPQFPEITSWLYTKIEQGRPLYSKEQKKSLLEALAKSEFFETFLHVRYPGQKRFSIEGNETCIAALSALVHEAAKLGIQELIFGMSHRGRLNALANVLEKPLHEMFVEFEADYKPSGSEKRGDVKYHKGYERKVALEGHQLRVYLAANPSHLESVNPVVEGFAKARQQYLVKSEEVLPVLMHGDAAFAGQGVVYETLQLSRIHGYSTKGTIHCIANNQIGYTAAERESRSTRYCTDIAKTFSIPVFHVNAEDPESALYVTLLALEIRQTFGIDVIVDFVGYRKYGHNETDEPSFTNPKFYQMIQGKESIYALYKKKLLSEKTLTESEIEALEKVIRADMESEYQKVKERIPHQESSGFTNKSSLATTAVPEKDLKRLMEDMTKIPPSFSLHRKMQKWVEERASLSREESPFIDWALAEHLAYGSLLINGFPVRLSGQDSIRGTFSHRHAAFFHQETEDPYFPLQAVAKNETFFHVFNSCLSEYAVMGFEYGYSLGDAKALVIWEGQFGDFANGAEIIIDQYIVAAEAKWGQNSSLILYLPHGYEGMGPEHSSARIERYLQMAGDENMRIVYPSTPAQWFHSIRLAKLSHHPVPTICFTPKGLLRYKPSYSPLSDLSNHSFHEVIERDFSSKSEIKILFFCTGKVYYDLLTRQEKEKRLDLAIIRIEQLYPFPEKALKALLSTYQNIKATIWIQEEPQNMGAYQYVEPLLRPLFSTPLEYAGREISASPATGSKKSHDVELEQFLNQAFSRRVS